MTDNKDESEIEKSKAPLVTHLIELRDRLKWAAIAFFIASVIRGFSLWRKSFTLLNVKSSFLLNSILKL